MKQAIKAKVTPLMDIGKHAQDVDAALPSKHTTEIYDALNKEAGTLAQLRTGMAGSMAIYTVSEYPTPIDASAGLRRRQSSIFCYCPLDETVN